MSRLQMRSGTGGRRDAPLPPAQPTSPAVGSEATPTAPVVEPGRRNSPEGEHRPTSSAQPARRPRKTTTSGAGDDPAGMLCLWVDTGVAAALNTRASETGQTQMVVTLQAVSEVVEAGDVATAVAAYQGAPAVPLGLFGDVPARPTSGTRRVAHKVRGLGSGRYRQVLDELAAEHGVTARGKGQSAAALVSACVSYRLVRRSR